MLVKQGTFFTINRRAFELMSRVSITFMANLKDRRKHAGGHEIVSLQDLVDLPRMRSFNRQVEKPPLPPPPPPERLQHLLGSTQHVFATLVNFNQGMIYVTISTRYNLLTKLVGQTLQLYYLIAWKPQNGTRDTWRTWIIFVYVVKELRALSICQN